MFSNRTTSNSLTTNNEKSANEGSNMKKYIFYLLFLISHIAISAQENNNSQWNVILYLNGGYSLATSDWEYTHPYYLGNGGTFTGRISGTYEENYGFLGGLELSKGYLGYEANIGVFPAKFLIEKQVDPGITQTRNDVYSYNSVFLEVQGILFPFGNPIEKITPFIKLGAGGMMTSGDIKNNLFSLSGSAGTRIFLSDNFGLDFSIKYRYLLLYDVTLADEISAAYGVSLSSFSINVGILYSL